MIAEELQRRLTAGERRFFRADLHGALRLAQAGLLDGLEATTHHGAIDLLRAVAPKTTVHADRRFVDKGRVVRSAGIAVGFPSADDP